MVLYEVGAFTTRKSTMTSTAHNQEVDCDLNSFWLGAEGDFELYQSLWAQMSPVNPIRSATTFCNTSCIRSIFLKAGRYRTSAKLHVSIKTLLTRCVSLFRLRTTGLSCGPIISRWSFSKNNITSSVWGHFFSGVVSVVNTVEYGLIFL